MRSAGGLKQAWGGIQRRGLTWAESSCRNSDVGDAKGSAGMEVSL